MLATEQAMSRTPTAIAFPRYGFILLTSMSVVLGRFVGVCVRVASRGLPEAGVVVWDLRCDALDEQPEGESEFRDEPDRP